MSDETQRKRKYTKRRESWGSKRKLPSGRYQASYLGPDGERYTGPQTFDTLGDARAWLGNEKRKIDAGKWKSPRAIQAERFGEYATAYITQGLGREGKSFSPKTRETYEWYVDVPLAEFKEVQLRAITPAMVRIWHAKRMKGTPTSAAREASFMHAVFERALHDELVERNPVAAELRKSKTGRKHRAPSMEELASILEWYELHAPELTVWLWIAAYGSPRKSEARALRRGDLTKHQPDEDDREQDYYTVSIERQAYKVGKEWHVLAPKSDAGTRTIALPAWLTPTIDAHMLERVGKFKGSLLFPPVDAEDDFYGDGAFDYRWRKAREYAGVLDTGVVVRLHDLRGLALTLFVQTSATQREIQARGGALYDRSGGPVPAHDGPRCCARGAVAQAPGCSPADGVARRAAGEARRVIGSIDSRFQNMARMGTYVEPKVSWSSAASAATEYKPHAKRP